MLHPGPAVVPRHRVHIPALIAGLAAVCFAAAQHQIFVSREKNCLPAALQEGGISRTVTPDRRYPRAAHSTPVHRRHAGIMSAHATATPSPFPGCRPWIDVSASARPAAAYPAVPDSPVHNGPPTNSLIPSAAIHHLLLTGTGTNVFLLCRGCLAAFRGLNPCPQNTCETASEGHFTDGPHISAEGIRRRRQTPRSGERRV